MPATMKTKTTKRTRSTLPTTPRGALDALYANAGHHTPLGAAKLLAVLFARHIPATFEEYILSGGPRSGFNSYEFSKMIQEWCKFRPCTFRQADAACQKVAPAFYYPE